MFRVLKKIDSFLAAISYKGLVISLSLMLGLSVMSIVFRWFNITFMWLDPFVRHLVFLSAFLGGSLATGAGKHIGIDLMSKLLEQPKYQHWSLLHLRLISLASTIVLVWIAKGGYDFMMVEFEFGRAHFLGIHSGFLVGIIPLGFILIGARFFLKFMLTFENAEVEKNA